MTNGPFIINCKLQRDSGQLPMGKGLVAVGYLPMVKKALAGQKHLVDEGRLG